MADEKIINSEENKIKNEPVEEVYEAEIVDDSSPEKEPAIDQEEDSQKIKELQESLARLQADFVNYRNRTEREKMDYFKYANEELIVKLLPALDNFDRAFQNCEENDDFVKGMRLVYDDLFKTLEKEGLSEIEADGTSFDHMIHNAVMTEAVEGVDANQILETFQKGYRLKDKVIRPSMVKVSK